jgi:hypothetical protein
MAILHPLKLEAQSGIAVYSSPKNTAPLIPKQILDTHTAITTNVPDAISTPFRHVRHPLVVGVTSLVYGEPGARVPSTVIE